MRSNACASIQAIARYAESSPQSPALIEPDGNTLTYKELWAEILAVGSRLQEAGIGPRETVAVLSPQGTRQVLGIAGVLNRGVCAPLQPRTNVDEVKVALGKLGASALIVSSEFEAETRAAIAMGLNTLVAFDRKFPGDWQICRPASPSPIRATIPNAILLLTTSATTGSSKVVPLTAVNLDAQTTPRSEILRLTEADRLLQMTSLCHSMGIENTLAQFLVGGAVIATGGFDPAEYLRWIRDLKPTWYDCAPAVHQAALAQLKANPIGLPYSLRLVQSAGAPLHLTVKQEIEQILQVPVLNDYGMTETGPIATDAFLPGDRIPNSVGRSYGSQVAVMDPSGELLQSDEDGEVVVRGPAVFSGYTDDPAANDTAFQNGWFRTGDLGRLDQDGNLYVTGRLKEMINRGGEKILPGEVDAALVAHPEVLEAAAFAVPHPTLGEDVACAVVLRASSETPVSAVELRRFAAERLASFKVPRRIYFVDEIPLGELGKPQRWLLAERVRGEHGTTPPIELTGPKFADDFVDVLPGVHEIWSRVLDRDDLGFEEDFFEAGGDSLAAINMLAEVDQRFGSQTSESAASFLDEPTLDHLARLVGNRQPPRPTASASSEFQIFPVRQAGTSKQLFCIPPDGQEGLCFRRLAAHLYGHMDLSIIRPANTFHGFALFSLEREGEEVAALIRRTQREGPYFVSGFCYGGVVAFEAARQLTLKGQDVRLILYDVIMPGYHSLLSRFRRKMARLWHGRRILRNHNPIELPSKFLRNSAEQMNFSHIARLVAWRIMIPIRWLAIPFERVPGVQRFLQWAQVDYFPFYKARPLDAPILHFLSTEERAGFEGVARFGWRRVARRGVDERYLPMDHPNLFHESNLPKIIDNLQDWCGGF
jgi:acyl-CoA synthetase (AMP-forming)/AMP-acid ligase II/acyl carrier protein